MAEALVNVHILSCMSSGFKIFFKTLKQNRNKNGLEPHLRFFHELKSKVKTG
jgi:hypothetical protein